MSPPVAFPSRAASIKMPLMPEQEEMPHVDVPICVRYSETDQMGHAYYSNYLVWFEVARTAFCKARGFRYSEMERSSDTFLPVVEVRCRYRKPVRYDDQLIVRTEVVEFRRRSMIFSYAVLSFDGSVRHAEGSTRHVFINSQGKTKSFPEEYRKFFCRPPVAADRQGS